ncbi:hypothetical protein CFY87_05870 [Actinobacillus seminis]|uniref:Phage-associated protein, HI1409 family n=2 Tax=Actinobacillus seminis TaxID=722 RepID=A0A263HCV3_9PAST|nr:anti-CBASS Acb1 family protein [Actinobacillus seminis]OZN24862.1 hypothetical protein CFY87_05870 [Actinobacillus seminis]SUU36727.1 phage-associated protein, HI1409 family [Actinobacillus seminis]
MFGFFKKIKAPDEVEEKKEYSYYSSGHFHHQYKNDFFINQLDELVNANNKLQASLVAGQDSNGDSSLKMPTERPSAISIALANWYAGKSFIGYQMCAILSQNWLIGKACSTPARDATRNGFNIVTVNGDDIPDETIKIIQKFDKKFKIKKNCEEFVRLGRIFGIRIAIFDIDSSDPDFYEKPFNIDGVEPNSYKGIIQVDPYWCIPILVSGELNNPATQYFYDPTYWQINGKKYHRSHLIIFRNEEVAG